MNDGPDQYDRTQGADPIEPKETDPLTPEGQVPLAPGGQVPLAPEGMVPAPSEAWSLVPVAPTGAVPEPAVHTEARRSGRRIWIVGAAVVAVVALGGAGAYAYSLLAGGGVHPEDRLPDTTVAVASIDLDPSSGQKIAAYQFLRRFKALQPTFQENDNLISTLLKESSQDASTPPALSFDADVKPWLGKRAAIAGVIVNDTLEPVLAIQVSDEDKARTALPKVIKAIDTSMESSSGGSINGSSDGTVDGSFNGGNIGPSRLGGFEVSGGYALIAKDDATAAAVASAASAAPLAKDQQFLGDLSSVGGSGIVTGWIDNAAFTKALNKVIATSGALPPEVLAQNPNPLGGSATGRSVFALRFTSNTAEIQSRSLGGTAVKLSDAPPIITAMPATTTVGALGWRGLDTGVDQAWQSLLDQVQKSAGSGESAQDLIDAAAADGFKLPQDIKTLVGSSGALVFTTDTAVGGRFVTDPAAASEFFGRLQPKLTTENPEVPPLTSAALPNGLAVASTPDLLGSLSQEGGLGASPRFASAVPEVRTAGFVFYVDGPNLSTLLSRQGVSNDDQAKDALAQLSGFGFALSPQSDGWSSRVRLVLN